MKSKIERQLKLHRIIYSIKELSMTLLILAVLAFGYVQVAEHADLIKPII